MSARPHQVGSPFGKENAEFIASLYRSWGYETAIERFDVLFPTPTKRVVELVAPTRYQARLVEPALKVHLEPQRQEARHDVPDDCFVVLVVDRPKGASHAVPPLRDDSG